MLYTILGILFLLALGYLFIKLYPINNSSTSTKKLYSLDYDISEAKIDNTTPIFGDQIPKIIIQTWKTKTIPNNYQSDVNSLKKLNPDYEYKYFADEDIILFLKSNYPEYYETYKKLPIKIQKIDFFRYIAVYHYGGFYFDLDITGLHPLDEILNNQCIFPIDEFITSGMCYNKRYQYYCDHGQKFLLGQYAFGARPKDPFLKTLIDHIHTNIDKYISRYEPGKPYENYVYKTTGPDFVTDVYMDYKDKSSVQILEYDKRQYFGKYARHNYRGTWK
jgi:mannosyltransferase OCH1-like enzyme